MTHHIRAALRPEPQALTEVVRVNDIIDEMNGLPARFLSDFAATRADGTAVAFTSGSTHTIADWNGNRATAVIDGATVPKTTIEPATTTAAGVRRYDVGLAGQRSAITRNKASLAGTHPTAERERLTQLLARRQRIHSQMWVRQMMYNRFDADILLWTEHYNSRFSPSVALDPNIPKSIFFQESRMGTNGRFLLMPPYAWDGSSNHPIMSRFNLGQAIDSFGPQQWLMIREMAPAIATAKELDRLAAGRAWFGMTNQQYLDHPTYLQAVKEFFEARRGGNNLMGTAGVDLHLDYGFWIRTAIRWLFIKKRGRTWPEAVRAYNGGGASARTYRDTVMGRVGGTNAITAADNETTESYPESGSGGARLSWENLNPIRNSRGVLQSFFVVTGAPPNVARAGDESHAVFNLKVENTNSVYNHQDVETRVRFLRQRPGRIFERVYPAPSASNGWNVVSQTDLVDESSRIIPIRLPRRILEAAYAPDWPFARVEVEYRWREADQITSYNTVRTGMDIVLVAPVELMFQQKSHVQRVDFSQLPTRDPDGFKRKFWIPLRSMEFSQNITSGDQFTMTISSRVSHGSSASSSQATRQGTSNTSQSSRTTGFAVTTSAASSRESSVGASVEIFEVGIKNMMEFGLSQTFSQSVTRGQSSTVSSDLTRSVTASRTFQSDNSQTFQSQFTYGPRGMPSTGRSASAVNLGVFLAPIVDYYAVPFVRFSGVDRFGQATQRTEGRTLIPYVRKWRTLVRPD